MICFFFFICARFGGKTIENKEDISKALQFLPIFLNEPTRLCKISQNGNVNYHQYVNGFLDFIRSSVLYDPEYIRHLEQYRPKPFEKIKSMDYIGLSALLTMITKGESMSDRKDYICQIIHKGYIVQILQRLREIAM